MTFSHTTLSEWAVSERAAWALSAPKWKNLAYLTLGMSIGFFAGLVFSGFGV
ncbi:hypothetical protein [Azospirillum sp. TSA2s]|jgi:hypothetical protein|uniref:hypothetical protein n=1 Tax=Azospirillum sp. TSA2s TaxID=709810 RepID=UPI00145A07DF|nr:hypothetical protein [Azospirillum sp. TSA2s]